MEIKIPHWYISIGCKFFVLFYTRYQCSTQHNESYAPVHRSSLTLLEGWACQVGFKDAVLHHLAKLSSILDILAMSPQQLLQVSSHTHTTNSERMSSRILVPHCVEVWECSH